MKQLVSLASSIVRSNLPSPNRPFKLTYATTYRCNSGCTLCSIWKRKVFNELSLDEIQTFFSKNSFFNWIDVTGGEVFLRPRVLDIFKIILSTQKNLYMLHTQTNGILTHKLTHDILAILALRPCLFVVTFSIDGPPTLHNKLRGIKNNWHDTVATYKTLQKYISNHFKCYFGMTLSGYNEGMIEATYQSLKTVIPSLSRHDMHFNIAHHSSHYYGNEKTKFGSPKNTTKEIADFNKKSGKRWDGVSIMDSLYQRRVLSYLETHKTPVPCKALSSSFFMDPNGTIYPCSMWNLAFGNIRDISFDLKKIWKSPLLEKTRGIIDLKKCPNCWTPCEAYQSILGNLAHLV